MKFQRGLPPSGGAANRDALNLANFFNRKFPRLPRSRCCYSRRIVGGTSRKQHKARLIPERVYVTGRFLAESEAKSKMSAVTAVTISLSAGQSLPKCNAIIIICSLCYSSPSGVTRRNTLPNVVVSLFGSRQCIYSSIILDYIMIVFWIMDNDKSSC